MSILIIGGDSRLSNFLYPLLKLQGYSVSKTTRKKKIYKDELFLDLKDIEYFVIPDSIKWAVILGGVTSYDDCENNFDYAYDINCIKIPFLIKKFIKNNIKTIFISSNVVFKNQKKIPSEYDFHNPGFPYASLKSITEKKLNKIVNSTNSSKLISIVRLTKNVCENTSPFNSWIKKINNNENFLAFEDLYFAPITFLDSSKIILEIIKKNLFGVFHLSGQNDINYSDFAIGLLKYLNLNTDLCQKKRSYEIGIKLKYNHHITALNMSFTKKLTRIEPVKLDAVFNYLSKHIK